MEDDMVSNTISVFHWKSHNSTFRNKLSTFWEKGKYTDVTLACQGKFFQVHKLALSTCSEYFENIFENTPCKHPVIVLNDIEQNDLELLLRFIYKGVIRVSQNNQARLMKVAESLLIKGLGEVQDENPSLPKNKKARSSKDDQTSPPTKRKKCKENSPPSSENLTQFRPNSTEIDLYTATQQSDSTPGQESTDSEFKGFVDEYIMTEDNEEISDNSLADEEDYQCHSENDDTTLDDSPDLKHKQPKHLESLDDGVSEDLAGPSGLQRGSKLIKEANVIYIKTEPDCVIPCDAGPVSHKLKRLASMENAASVITPVKKREGTLTQKLNNLRQKAASTEDLALETYLSTSRDKPIMYNLNKVLLKAASTEDIPPELNPVTLCKEDRNIKLKKKIKKVKDEPSNLDSSGEPITYSLKLGATIRGADKLIDSLGYTYILKRDARRPNHGTWVCSLQLKGRCCTGKVNIRNGEYNFRNVHNLCDPHFKIHKKHTDDKEKACKKNKKKETDTTETNKQTE